MTAKSSNHYPETENGGKCSVMEKLISNNSVYDKKESIPIFTHSNSADYQVSSAQVTDLFFTKITETPTSFPLKNIIEPRILLSKVEIEDVSHKVEEEFLEIDKIKKHLKVQAEDDIDLSDPLIKVNQSSVSILKTTNNICVLEGKAVPL